MYSGILRMNFSFFLYSLWLVVLPFTTLAIDSRLAVS